jgi:inner membrane protein
LDGAVGSVLTSLPDKLEPAIHPNHRQFFHSVVFAAGVGYVTYKVYNWQPTEDWEKILRWLVVIGGVAYLIHLVLDAHTAKSLPLFGKL